MNIQESNTNAGLYHEDYPAASNRQKRSQDLWDKTAGMECEVCMGLTECPECGRYVLHFAEQVYRVMIHLVDMDMPKDQFEEFAGLLDRKDLWLEAAHYTICPCCERMDVILDDYTIFHRRHGDKNSLEVWGSRLTDAPEHYYEDALLFSAHWIGISEQDNLEKQD